VARIGANKPSEKPQAISETAGPERSQHDTATSARPVLGLADAEVADDEIVAPDKDVDQLSVLFDGGERS